MDTPFFGAHAVSRSTNFADALLINLYGEVEESKQGKGIGALYGMPWLTTKVTVGAGPINGMHVLGSTLYVVSGTELYSLNTSFGATDIGALGGTSAQASIIDNGTQLAVFMSGIGTSLNAGVLANITLPYAEVGTIIAAQQDGFGLIIRPTTNQVFQSNSLDLTTWAGANFGSATGNPDAIVAIAQVRRELFFIKTTNTEVWVNAGTTGFTFQRLDGVFVEVGCVAPRSVTKINENLCWLSQTSQGQGVVVELTGYQSRRISTHAIENEIQNYSTISDAIGYAFEYNGHSFYVLTFPTANMTWAYDKTSSDQLQTPMWLKWPAWSGSVFTRNPGNAFAFFAGLPLVGDYQNGTIYTVDPAAFPPRWLRTWRALAKPVYAPVRFSSLLIDMEMGGTGTTGTPTVSLRWSDDGGHTYSSSYTGSVGALGDTTKRLQFTRLGSTRRNSGLDRIFELSSTSTFPARLIGAQLA